MANLTRFEQDGLELVIDTVSGECFASRNALARMCNVEPSTITRWKGSAEIETVEAEIPTAGGIQGSALFDEDSIHDAFLKYNPALLKQCAKAGIRVFLYELAGYKVAVQLPAVPQTYAEALLEAGKLALEKEQLEAEKALLEAENTVLSEAVDELFDYSSILRIAKFNNCSERNFSWRTLKAASIKMGVEIKQVPCPRFEFKNLYSHDVWRFCYPGMNLPETTTLVIKQ